MRLERIRSESHPTMTAVIAVVFAQMVMGGNVHAWQ